MNFEIWCFRLLYLHQFMTMCHFLATVVTEPQFRMQRYTLCWVVRALLHLTSGHTALLATSFLYHFLSLVLHAQCCISIVDSLLSLITNTLVPLANQSSSLGKILFCCVLQRNLCSSIIYFRSCQSDIN